MPISCQALYFHLGLHADDDGVVEAYTVIKQCGCTEDDLRVLVAKGFVQVLNDDLVSYITDWNENNSIRPDRKIDSIYKELLVSLHPEVQLVEKRQRADAKPKTKSLDNQWTTNGQPTDGIGKDRLGKVREGKDRIDYNAIADAYNRICVSLPKCTKLSDGRKKHIKARLKSFTPDQIELAYSKAEASDFLTGKKGNWKASFDWIIKSDDNILKILEGKYDNCGSSDKSEWSFTEL